MRTFHLITHFSLGGAERVAANIAESQTHGMEYHVVEIMRGRTAYTPKFIAELEQAGVRCHRSWMPDVSFHFLFERIAALLFPLRMLYIMLRWRPDVIHTHTETPDLALYVFSRVFLSPGILLQVQETSSDFRFTLLFYRVEQIRHMLGNTVVSMRLYSTLYPSACTVAHTGYEEMLSSYAQMLLRLEQKEEPDTYSLHEQKLLLMAVTYRLCSINQRGVKHTLGTFYKKKIAEN